MLRSSLVTMEGELKRALTVSYINTEVAVRASKSETERRIVFILFIYCMLRLIHSQMTSGLFL